MKRREFIKIAGVAAAALYGVHDNLLLAQNSTPDVVRVTGGEPVSMLQTALNEFGGLKTFISKGDVVVVKPNIGWDRAPELAGNTNPDLIAEIVKQCLALGAKKVASIYSPDNTGVASPQQIGSDTIKALGGVDQSTVLTAPTGTKDFGPQITKIIEANPDAVIVNLVTADGAAFMKQARDRGLKAKFIAGHNGLLDLNILKLSSGAAEGLIVPSHFDPNDPNPQTKKFVDAWTKKFGPLEDLISSYSWDMIFTIKAVMEKAGTATDRQKIRDTWGATENLCLAGGCYTWKGKGDRTNATVFPVVLGSAGFVKFTK